MCFQRVTIHFFQKPLFRHRLLNTAMKNLVTNLLCPPENCMARTVHLVITGIVLWLAWCFSHNHPAFSNESNYNAFAAMMTEMHWSYFCTVIGSISLALLLVPRWKYHAGSAALLAFAHTLFSFLLIVGHATGIISGFFVANVFLSIALVFQTAYSGVRHGV